MKMLLTGAFGNLGRCILEESSARGHEVTVFELPTKKNEKTFKKVKKHITNMVWGDLTDKKDVAKAVEHADSIIHLAAVIPPLSEMNKELCDRVNIDGTGNILEAVKETGRRIPLVYASSSSVMGDTQKKQPPVRADQVPAPFGNYAISKVKAEKMILASSVPACITRFGGVLTTKTDYSLDMLVYGFEFPYRARYEVVLDIDLASAVVNGAEKLYRNDELNKKIFFIGGGEQNGCRIYHNELYDKLFKAIGLTPPKKDAYENNKPCMVDWLDTEESQKYLDYQTHHLDYYINHMKKKVAVYRPFLFIFKGFISRMLEKKSPYLAVKEK